MTLSKKTDINGYQHCFGFSWILHQTLYGTWMRSCWPCLSSCLLGLYCISIAFYANRLLAFYLTTTPGKPWAPFWHSFWPLTCPAWVAHCEDAGRVNTKESDAACTWRAYSPRHWSLCKVSHFMYCCFLPSKGSDTSETHGASVSSWGSLGGPIQEPCKNRVQDGAVSFQVTCFLWFLIKPGWKSSAIINTLTLSLSNSLGLNYRRKKGRRLGGEKGGKGGMFYSW